MDLATAHALLCVDAGVDLATAQRAYRERARLVHPDRAGDGLAATATRAMAQLTQAWDVVRDGAPRTADVRAHRCPACSFQPARVVRSTSRPAELVFDRTPRPACTCRGAATTPVRV